ncbi:hypothetical protein DYB32_004257 [Aphanomyces invadans]|uniref:Jacalin-type lectin domain-containing protein n=1 Tax=Aphanomyces invadans TaxID=157072 RepID=A0A3R6WMP5_9STRA|nr:hypothetical protein DYB32_004257 [Aphanomyces invadans]
MDLQRREKQQETTEKLAAEFPIPKWYDLSLPVLPVDAIVSAAAPTSNSPFKPRMSRMNTALQLDIVRQQVSSSLDPAHPQHDLYDSLSDEEGDNDDVVAYTHDGDPPSERDTNHAPPRRKTPMPNVLVDHVPGAASTEVATMGMHRRQTMADIGLFAETYLKKKFFKRWDAIEFAFSGACVRAHAGERLTGTVGGDLSQAQVERVLQSNGVVSTEMDVDRIRSDIHTYMTTHAIDADDATDFISDAVHFHVKKDDDDDGVVPRFISLAMLRDMFYPKDPTAIAQWTAELQAEKKAAADEQTDRNRQRDMLERKIKQRLQTTAQGMVRVLDRFDFMHAAWPSATVKAATTDQLFKVIFHRKRKAAAAALLFETQDKSATHGSRHHSNNHEECQDDANHAHRSVPVVLNALLQTYGRNRGLDDVDLEDAAHVFHDVAANAIQNGARQYFARQATFWFPERQEFFAFQLKKRVFRNWRDRARQLRHQRHVVFRKFVAWRYRMLLATRYRELYRICFWPLYVWKRYVQFVLLSRGKALFLRRVVHTYVQLRIVHIRRRKYLCFHGVLAKTADAWDGDSAHEKVPLTRMMESHLGSKIKLKSHTHELGMAMYIKYRKKDRQAIQAMAMVFKRVAPMVFRLWVLHRELKKRGRFATELGLFRLLSEHFSTWLRFLLHRKHQEALRRASSKRLRDKVQDVNAQAAHDEPNDAQPPISKRALQWRADREWRDAGTRIAQAAVDAIDLAAMLHTLAQQRVDSTHRFAAIEAHLADAKQAEARLQHEEETKSAGMRFAYWEAHIDRFHTLKSMWHMWRKWIAFIRYRAQYESPGLARNMQRRRVLVSKFEGYLVDQDFMLIPTVLDKKLSYNSYKAVFVRWVEWTQLAHASNAMIRHFRARVERRPTADIERVRSSLWSKRKHLVSRRIRKVLSACDRKLRLSVCSNPTLKHLFAMHSKDIMKRLNLENRLMFVAYNERQVHHYEERLSPLMGGEIGQRFEYADVVPFGHIHQVNVICGKSVDGIAVLVKSYNRTTEGKIHGNPFGNSSIFLLGPGELLIAIEGYATQSTILGIRFGTTQGRWSKWYGRADAGLPFLLRGEEGEEIVGLHGYAAKDSVNGLGVCFRRTTEHNVFEGLWLDHVGHKFEAPTNDTPSALTDPPGNDRIHV